MHRAVPRTRLRTRSGSSPAATSAASGPASGQQGARAPSRRSPTSSRNPRSISTKPCACTRRDFACTPSGAKRLDAADLRITQLADASPSPAGGRTSHSRHACALRKLFGRTIESRDSRRSGSPEIVFSGDALAALAQLSQERLDVLDELFGPEAVEKVT